MAVLVVVFAVLVVSYASSMRAYLNQHAQIAALQAQIASSQRDIHGLKVEKTRWRDNAFVEQQARERFGWVMPGDTAYQVIGVDGKPLTGSDQLDDPTAPTQSTPTAWWSKAYGSLEAADHPHVNVKPAPLTRITQTGPSGKH